MLPPCRGTFYLFKTGDTWPNKVTEDKTGVVLPIQLVTTNPDMFTPENRYILPATPMADRFYQSWGRMWFNHKIVGTMKDMSETWVGSAIMFLIFAEFLGIVITTVGWQAKAKTFSLSEYFVFDDAVRFMTWGIFSAPLRTLYRHGPGFSTPVGELGFWGGKKLPDICAQVTSLEAHYWKEHVSDCHNIYRAKEEGFVSLIALGTVAFMCFVAYKLVMLYLKQLD